MGLLDIFKRQGAAGAAAAAEPVEAARSRARRRLIGAVVLLGVGVVAFPLLFETQPRPIPVDIPIEIPSRDGVPPLALPSPKVVANTAPVAPPAAKAAASSVPASAAEPRLVPTQPDAAPKATAAKPVAVLPPAAPADKPAAEPSKPAAEVTGRFVVQVGAFAEASAVREARAKLEKLGLASYTQVVETSNGPRTRVRLGPYGSREDAEKAAARLKAAGLPGAVLTL